MMVGGQEKGVAGGSKDLTERGYREFLKGSRARARRGCGKQGIDARREEICTGKRTRILGVATGSNRRIKGANVVQNHKAQGADILSVLLALTKGKK